MGTRAGATRQQRPILGVGPVVIRQRLERRVGNVGTHKVGRGPHGLQQVLDTTHRNGGSTTVDTGSPYMKRAQGGTCRPLCLCVEESWTSYSSPPSTTAAIMLSNSQHNSGNRVSAGFARMATCVHKLRTTNKHAGFACTHGASRANPNLGQHRAAPRYHGAQRQRRRRLACMVSNETVPNELDSKLARAAQRTEGARGALLDGGTRNPNSNTRIPNTSTTTHYRHTAERSRHGCDATTDVMCQARVGCATDCRIRCDLAVRCHRRRRALGSLPPSWVVRPLCRASTPTSNQRAQYD